VLAPIVMGASKASAHLRVTVFADAMPVLFSLSVCALKTMTECRRDRRLA
jgi:hypothetical protein